jgi:hypothetical protein
VNCRLYVIDSQKFCGLICSRERGYSRCRRLRTVLDLAPACLARLAGAFLCGTNSLRGPSSLCVQGCPEAQLRCLWCTGPGGFSTPAGATSLPVVCGKALSPQMGGQLFRSSRSLAMLAEIQGAGLRANQDNNGMAFSPGRRGRSAVRFRPLHPNKNLHVRSRSSLV